MDEEMRVDLVPVDAELLEKLPVLVRDEIEFALVVTAAGFEHHEVVVAAQGDEIAALAQLQELLDDTARVGTAVDIIAQRDNLIVRSQRDRLQEPLQDVGVTVDVADGKVTHDHSSGPP